MKLPILFEDRMRKLLGEEYEEYLQCFDKPHFGGLRVNTLKISPVEFEHICPFSIKRIPWIKNGYYFNTDQQPSKHSFYHAGLYYIQEPSAMTPASLLPITKGDKVLDLCAAPGGKSTELGAKLGGEGILVTNDISNSRAKGLLKNIELFGIRNSLVLSEAPGKLVEYFPEYFDKILIDAPCSGEGMFRKSSDMIKNWEQYGVEYYSELQKDIVVSAAKMLKPGGYILYSTCTFSPEENEGTITHLLEQCPEFHVVNAIPDDQTQRSLGLSYEGFDFGKPEWINGKEELKNCIRLWPHKIDGEGHFIALLHKEVSSGTDFNRPDSTSTNPMGKSKNILSEEAIDFVKNLSFPVKQELLVVHDEKLYLLPEGLPNLKGLRMLRQGLLLGEMKKQRFEPSQALANALRTSEYDKILRFSIDDTNVVRYLKCESIQPDGDYSDGWYLICVEDFPLGWGKMTKNNFKNKYQPGWRML
ncbi:MAG: RsmF rRNA methyltransferase first C-terminal domain-containing protein [Mobilitalea sp.]